MGLINASVLLKAYDLVTSRAYVVIKAANEFKDKTAARGTSRWDARTGGVGLELQRRKSHRTSNFIAQNRLAFVREWSGTAGAWSGGGSLEGFALPAI